MGVRVWLSPGLGDCIFSGCRCFYGCACIHALLCFGVWDCLVCCMLCMVYGMLLEW